MKTVTKDSQVKRVDEKTAGELLRHGWKYCPKGLWKAQTRSAKKEGK